MSRIAALLLVLFGARAWAAEGEVRLLISVGSDYGAPDDAVLQFAEQDATRVRDVMVELGGVEPARALLLRRATESSVRDALVETRGRVGELHAQGHSVTLFVFVSAHGEPGALHLSGTRLPMDELRALVKDTGADLRVEVVDACDAGAGARAKGAHKGQGYALSLSPQPVKGEVFIASSAANEAAQEWDVLSGSLFTHHWLTGLRGDADQDRDGKVTLMEAYAHAARLTVADSLEGGQHPSYELGLTGAEDLVLTEPKRAKGHVVLGPELEGRFVLVSQPAPELVAELMKEKGRPLTLAVPAGRYLLRHTQGRKVGIQEVELPYGGDAEIDGRRLVYRDFAEVALKGSQSEFRPNAAVLQTGPGVPAVGGTPAPWLIGLGYRRAQGSLWAEGGLRFAPSRFRAVELTVDQAQLAVTAGAGLRLWLGPVVVMPGVQVSELTVRQRLTRDDEALLRRSYPALSPRWVFGGSAGPELLVQAPLPWHLFAELQLAGAVRYLPRQDKTAPAWTLGADAAIGGGVRF